MNTPVNVYFKVVKYMPMGTTAIRKAKSTSLASTALIISDVVCVLLYHHSFVERHSRRSSLGGELARCYRIRHSFCDDLLEG